MECGGLDHSSKDIFRDYKLTSLKKFYKRTNDELKEVTNMTED